MNSRKKCWKFGRAVINTNTLLGNYLWAYLIYLCLLFLAYLVFHQVNCQNTSDTNLGSSSQGKTSSSWRGKPMRNYSYIFSNDKYHDQDSDPWPIYASKTLSCLLYLLPMLILPFFTNLHWLAPTLENSDFFLVCLQMILLTKSDIKYKIIRDLIFILYLSSNTLLLCTV